MAADDWQITADTNVPYRLYDIDEVLTETGHYVVHTTGRPPWARPYSIALPEGDTIPVRFDGLDASGWPTYRATDDTCAIALHPSFFSAVGGGVRIP